MHKGKKMEQDQDSRMIRTAFTASMGVIAFFLGFVPVLLGYVSKTLGALPQWVQVLVMTFPLQIAYLGAVLLPAMRFQRELPLLVKLELILPRAPWKSFALAGICVIPVYPLLAALTFLNGKLLNCLSIRSAPQELAVLLTQGSPATVAVIVLAGVILAPFGEELVFRYAIYRHFTRFAPPWTAACVSAFLFAASHFNIRTFPALFLLALFLQNVFLRTRSLSCAIYAHALYNLITIALIFLSRSIP